MMNRPIKIAEYQNFEPLPSLSQVVYGPFSSRRLGMTLGINFFGSQKICSFDCPYCELGRTTIRMNQLKKDLSFLPPESMVEEIRKGMLNLQNQKISHILISGNGEPTLYPHLSEVIEPIVKTRDELFPQIPIVMMTNGVHLDAKKILNGLEKINEIMIKLDAGNENVFKLINSPLVRAQLPKVIAGARKLKSFSIQSFFVRGVIDNTKDSMIEEWIEVVGMMRPEKIYLYSLKRAPAIQGLIAADEDTLYIIASKLKRRTQIEALVFP